MRDIILLVDDNPANLMVLAETLKGRGYELLVAKNGKDTLRIAKMVRPKLILLDIIMPNMDGYTICHFLKEDKDTAAIPIIFLSALTDLDDKVKGFRLGAVDYISKPFQSEEVIMRVDTQIKMHRLECELLEKNAQLKASHDKILQAMSEGVLGLDGSEYISFANEAAAVMLGKKNRQLIGLHISDIIHHDAKKMLSYFHTMKKKLKKQKIKNGFFSHASGRALPVSFSITPMLDENNSVMIGAVIVFLDISEKLRQEQKLATMQNKIEQQKNRLMSMSRLSTIVEMTSGFAHEVNQPLTAILNYAQACSRMICHQKIEMNQIKEIIDKLVRQACRAGEIVFRIKNFVRKPHRVMVVIDCNEFIQETVLLAEVDSKENSVDIHVEMEKNLPLIVADRIQIQQVILNLLRNAMESMKDHPNQKKGVVIKAEQTENKVIKISVIDKGNGLTAMQEKKLFTPFFTTKATGVGIGLSICHSIIEEHHGHLKFHPNPNGGAIFSFTLPVNEEEIVCAL